MKIQIKTLKSKKYELEVKCDETVEEIKVKIQKELELGDASMMSLIHHGKILKNDQTANDAGFKENDFVVLMLKKKKKRAKRKDKAREVPRATAVSTSVAASEQPSSTAVSTSEAPAASPAQPQENPAAAQNSVDGANAFVMGNQLNEAVQNLVAMGFPEADVQRAMRAAFNNPERAAEYLISGIPANIGAAPVAMASANQPPAAQAAPNVAPAAAANPLGAAARPQANPMQQLMAQSPETMAAILQHIMRNQPELFRGMAGPDGSINPQAVENLLQDQNFMRMMMQAMSGGAGAGPGVGAGAGAGNRMMGQHAAHQQPPMGNANVIQLTQAEAASIERLQNLGFSKQQALEAFLVCNKNEQMAANYLFENASDFAAPRAEQVAANPAPQVAPPAQPAAVQADALPAAEQANDAQAAQEQPPQADEAVAAVAAPANQLEAIARAQRGQGNEAQNDGNAAQNSDNAADGGADAKDQEMKDANQ